MINFEFIILAYSLGPIIAVPYGLAYLILSPIEIFFYLSLVYIIPLPLIFKIFEFFGHRKIYRNGIIGKIYKTYKIKSEDETERILKSGDELIDYFKKKIGHLGFYFAISVFTFLFGIFWASFFAYILKVKRKRAFFAISSGVILGNFFWVIVLYYSLPKLQLEVLLILLLISLIIYGRKRELNILRKISAKLKMQSHAAK